MLVVAPVVAQWTMRSLNVGTIATGVSFVSNDVGYLPVCINGVGSEIQKTTDGGVTWTDDETAEPFSLLLLDIAARKGTNGNDNVVVVGALTLEYSTDGAVTFNSSLAPLGAGQCIRSIADTPGAFAAVGDWGLVTESNGPAVSYDYGFSYAAVNVSSLTTDSR